MPLCTILTKWPAPLRPMCVTHGSPSALAAMDSKIGFRVFQDSSVRIPAFSFSYSARNTDVRLWNIETCFMLLIRQICDMWHNWHLRWFNCTIIGICIKIVCYLKWIILVYHKHTIFRKKCPISSVNRLQLFKSVKFDPIKPIISPIL